MSLVRSQTYTYEIFDDQGPELMKTYSEDDWTHFIDRTGSWAEGTYTATTTPGASFSLTYEGSVATLYGGARNLTDVKNWPTANYVIDGAPGSAQKPYFDEDEKSIIYFNTPDSLGDGTHTIDVTVTWADNANPYYIDYFLVTPLPGASDSGIETTRAAPSSTATVVHTVIAHSVPVGPIVGGVVGGVAGIAILLVVAYYFLIRRPRGGRAYYFEKPGAADVLAEEDHVEPFNATPASPPASSAGFNGRGPQSAYSDSSSNQPLNPSFGQTAADSQYTHTSTTSGQPRTGKAALIAQQYEDMQQPVQLHDSGMRFNENGEQEAGPSQLPTEVPPTYTPN